jgi:exonuclease III
MSVKILQYNVNKSKNKVLAGLLADPRVREFDIIAVQEPWRNPYNLTAYSTRDSGFHLVDIRDKDSRVSTYVNKRISIDSWSEISYSPDAQLITLCLGATQINIHNIYSPLPASHTDNSKISTLTVLSHALRMPGEYVIVGDFNLYHPL